MNNLIHVSDAEFEAKVLNSNLPVIVDFWAPWCGPCKMIAPVLEQIAKSYDGKLIIAKVNTDENPEWATNYDVQGIPTMLFINHGEVVSRLMGVYPPPVIKGKVDALLQIAQVVHA